MPSGFIAYPGLPAEIGKELEAARRVLRESYGQHEIRSWVENDIAGRFLVEPILQHIRESDFLVADITKLNFNVTFEVGYAIGSSKRVFLVKNSLINDDTKILPELGIFDTLGYQTYPTGSEVAVFLSRSFSDLAAIPLFGASHRRSAPRVPG